jgi:hypothetical protein
MTFEYDDKGKFFTDVISKIPVSAMVQTTTHLVEGSIHVRRDERVKDELSRTQNFLALTDAKVFDSEGNILYASDFIAIQTQQIVWVLPKEDNKETQA